MSFDRLQFTTLTFNEPKVPSYFKSKRWNIDYLQTTNWKKAKRKILLVVDHLPAADIKNKQLFSEENYIVALLNEAYTRYKTHAKKATKAKDFAFTIVSYNFFKTYHLEDTELSEANKITKKRMASIIYGLKPTDVHFFGNDIPYDMFGYEMESRGSIFDEKITHEKKSHKFKFSFNISITKQNFTDEDDNDIIGEFSRNETNLANFACDFLSWMLLQEHPFSLSHLKPNYKLIETVEEFDKLIKKLYKAKYFAYDTETENLTAYHNKILTMQFTLDSEPELSYIVVCKHKDSPFNKKELMHVYTEMHKLLTQSFDHESWDTPYIIGQNLDFDLRVSRIEFGINVIEFRLHDTMAGAHALDENRKFLPTRNSYAEKGTRDRPFALDNLFAYYGNTFYQTAEFGKKNRATIDEEPIYFKTSSRKHNKPLLEYMAMDTVSVMGIHHMQKKQASHLRNGKKRFLPIFDKLILGVYTDTIHVMSTMRTNGLHADRDYIIAQVFSETSEILKEKDRLIEELYATKAVKRANKRLKKNSALPQGGGLFEGTDLEQDINLFDISLQDHQQLLFFDILKLKPVKKTKTGNSVGKAFKEKYSSKDKEGNPIGYYSEEVAIFAAIKEATKVMGYVKAFYQKLHDEDGLLTNAILAAYGFSGVVTGRSNSFDPSLQQTPNHGQYAKLIKKAFVSRKGRVNIKMDYSAHEVGCWSVLAGKGPLAITLRKVFNIKLKFRLKPTKRNKEKMDLADVHKNNYSSFTGTPVKNVDKVQRQSAKNITFGVMYGMAVPTMAEAQKITTEAMQKIFDAFFGKFAVEKRWLERTVRTARETLVTFDPFGARRNLPGYLMADFVAKNGLDRLAMNSPIQGFASRLGFIAARLLQIKMHKTFQKQGMYGEPYWDHDTARLVTPAPDFAICAMVHDSNEVDCSYELVPLVLRAMEHCSTTGMVDYTTKMYGLTWPIRPMVDFDILDRGDQLKGWDFTEEGLKDCIESAYKSANERGNKISKSDMSKALNPTSKVKKMMKEFPLKLEYMKEK